MQFIQGEDRRQEHLLPPRLEEYVGPAAPVRVIELFVNLLKLEEVGFDLGPRETGRPRYHPALLLKIFIYGYLYRIRSSRRLETECRRNLELIWLTENLRPDHWTIAAFRREYRGLFKQVLRDFNLQVRKLGLFGAELVAIDGAKFKAVNSPDRHYTDREIAELIAVIDQRIDEYVEQLDQADEATAEVPDEPTAEELAVKLAQLQTARAQHEALRDTLKNTGQSELSLSDPDSRGQKKVGVGYNVQIAVDAAHHLIVAATVEQAANDVGQLRPMAQAAQAELGVTSFVADAGYHERGQLAQCEAAGFTTYVPAPKTNSGRTSSGEAVYPKEKFTFDPAANVYVCPAGQRLAHRGSGQKHGKSCNYYLNMAACAACSQRGHCTTAPYRKISRLENELVVERQAARLATQPGMMARRRQIVEHVFGTMREWGHDKFLCRGLDMVRAEFSLTALAYNLRRALNVIGVQCLLQAMRPA
jgi:transposase